jgi:hypothetical protein
MTARSEAQQPPALESAVRELFGGRIVVGETPEVVTRSIPLADGVEVVAVHLKDDGESFAAILSSARDLSALLFDYQRALEPHGWHATKIGRGQDAFAFCSPAGALLQARPQFDQGGIRAKVDFEARSGACQVASALSVRVENPALRLLQEAEQAPGCTGQRSGGGSAAPEEAAWRLRAPCTSSIRDVTAHYSSRWQQLGWMLRTEDQTATDHLSTWDVPAFEGRRWYAVLWVHAAAGGDTARVLLNLHASE